MALLAVLEFGDNSIQRYSKQYLVSDCRFVFDRNHNAFSPEGAARCNQIEVVVVALVAMTSACSSGSLIRSRSMAES